MYAGGPASPGPGPVSNSTGVETRTNDSIVQYSINTSISPRTVESGGDAVYEMHGKKHVVPTTVLQSPVANSSVSFHFKIHLLLSFLLNLTFHHSTLHHLHHPVHCLTVTPRSPRKALQNPTPGSPISKGTTEGLLHYRLYHHSPQTMQLLDELLTFKKHFTTMAPRECVMDLRSRMPVLARMRENGLEEMKQFTKMSSEASIYLSLRRSRNFLEK